LFTDGGVGANKSERARARERLSAVEAQTPA
jgi:hypothetical protein